MHPSALLALLGILANANFGPFLYPPPPVPSVLGTAIRSSSFGPLLYLG